MRQPVPGLAVHLRVVPGVLRRGVQPRAAAPPAPGPPKRRRPPPPPPRPPPAGDVHFGPRENLRSPLAAGCDTLIMGIVEVPHRRCRGWPMAAAAAKPSLLVVDDEADLVQSVKDLLRFDYRVLG